MADYIEMSIPKAAIDEGGLAREWAIDLAVKGLSRNTGPVGSEIQAEVLAETVTLEHVLGVVTLSGTVAAWPCWILMNAVDLDQPVAEGLPNRLDGQSVRSWAQWYDPAISTGPRLSLDSNQTLIAGDGFGQRLSGAEVALLAALISEDFEVLCAAEARELLAGAAWQVAE